MADILYFCGFESGWANATGLLNAPDPVVSSVNPRSGQYCLEVVDGGSWLTPFVPAPSGALWADLEKKNQGTALFAIRGLTFAPGGGDTSGFVFDCCNLGVAFADFGLKTDGVTMWLESANGAYHSVNSMPFQSSADWKWCTLAWTYDGVNTTVDVRIDGHSIVEAISGDARPDTIEFGDIITNCHVTMHLDDFVVFDTFQPSGLPTDFKITSVMPQGGTVVGWTGDPAPASWQNWADRPGNATLNKTAANVVTGSASNSAFALTSEQIWAVTGRVTGNMKLCTVPNQATNAMKIWVGPYSMALPTRGFRYPSPLELPPSPMAYTWQRNPITGVLWKPEELAAGNVSIGIVTANIPAGNEIRVHQMMLEVLEGATQFYDEGTRPMNDIYRVLSDRDPYSIVLDAFWALLEQDEDFCTLVPPGNRIKFTGESRDPIKKEITSADVPEVRVVQAGSEPHPFGCSSMHRDVVKYEIQVASGDQRFDAMHNPVKWAVFKALTGATAFLRANVSYHNEKIVAGAKPVTVQEGVSSKDLNRGINGWSAIWACEVDLWFPVALFRR